MTSAADATASLFITVWVVVAMLMVLGGIGACGAFFAFIKFNGKKCVVARQRVAHVRDKAESKAISAAAAAAAFAALKASEAEGGWNAARLLVSHQDEVSVRLSLAVTKLSGSFRRRLAKKRDAAAKLKHQRQMEERRGGGGAATSSKSKTKKKKKKKKEKPRGGLFGALRRKFTPLEEDEAAAAPLPSADIEMAFSPTASARVLEKFVGDDEGY